MKDRPRILKGETHKVKTGYGNLYVTVNEEIEGSPVELFAVIGKSGQSTTAKAEAMGRLVTLSLKHGVNVERIVNQLKGIAGESPMPDGKEVYKSIPDAIASVLHYMYLSGDAASFPKPLVIKDIDIERLKNSKPGKLVRVNKKPQTAEYSKRLFYQCLRCKGEFLVTSLTPLKCPRCGSSDIKPQKELNEKHDRTELEKTYPLICYDCKTEFESVNVCSLCPNCSSQDVRRRHEKQ